MGGSNAGNGPPSGLEFAGLGFQFAAAIIVFLYLGKWLDAKFGTAPWLLLVGVFVGAGGGFYAMYRKLTRPPRD
jgi:F0F1-type ATP synthase assembly protein I